jgi:uncharacterized protein YjbJ (UPF0337 family)
VSTSIKGMLDRLKGNIKSATGRATKDRSLEMKGRTQQTKGSAKEAAQKTKDIFTQ